jgi:hypothetical protein
MASSISVTNIDATYPVAGQDNDSQGFRDNFSQIKTQLTTAGTEITSLQANKASTNATTSFNGHDVGQANLIDWSQKVNALGTVTSAAINLNSGNVVTLTTGGATTFSFSNFPTEDDGATNVAVKIKVIMHRAADSHSITMPAEVKMPYSMGDGADDSTAYTFPARKSTFVFDLFTVDGGTTIFISNPEEYDYAG